MYVRELSAVGERLCDDVMIDVSSLLFWLADGRRVYSLENTYLEFENGIWNSDSKYIFVEILLCDVDARLLTALVVPVLTTSTGNRYRYTEGQNR
jgi:hypothetical protein